MAGNLDAAEQALSNAADRGAEWNFLMGSIYVRRGWYDDARQYIQTACQMDPANMEYRMALANMSNTTAYYNQNRAWPTATTSATAAPPFLPRIAAVSAWAAI
jgi:cytochrome c-type biogenesis protein CcmH/NrfG